MSVIHVLNRRVTLTEREDETKFSPKPRGAFHNFLQSVVFWYLKRIKAYATIVDEVPDYEVFDTDDVARLAQQQVRALLHKGITPGHIFIGVKDLGLLRLQVTANGTAEFPFYNPTGPTLYNIPFTILPYMEGILVVPKYI